MRVRAGVAPLLVLALVGCSTGAGAAPAQPAGLAAPDRPASTAVASAAATPTWPASAVLAKVPAGAAPAGLAAGFGAVWVVGHPAAQIGRIDPRTDRYRAIPIPDSLLEQLCFLPWVGAGRVWVGHCDGGTRTLVVDPRRNAIVGAVPAFAIQAAFDGTGVWLEANDFRSVVRYDARTLRPTHVFPGEGLPVVGGGYAWVVRQGTDRQEIGKIDLRTDREVAVLHPPSVGVYGRTIFAFGALWEVGQGTGRLLRIDPATGRTDVYAIPGYAGLGGWEVFPLAAAGSIWLRASSGVVERFDPATGGLQASYPADAVGVAGTLTYVSGSLWVANVEQGTVWRDRV